VLSAEPQLRSPLTQNEELAQNTLRVAGDLNLNARLHKSYQHGLGWQYSVWIRGFLSEEAANSAAALLAENTGRGVDVLLADRAEQVQWLAPLAVLPSAENLRLRVVRALGGVNGGLQRLQQAESLSFSYFRHIPREKVKANHRLDRSAGFVRGEIIQPLFLRGPLGNWLTQGGVVRPAPASQIAFLEGEAAPESVYAGLLGMPALLSENLDYRDLRVVGQQLIDFRNAVRMEGEFHHEKVVLWVEASSALPISWEFHTEAGVVQLVFVGWRAVDSNLILPELMEVYGDGEFLDRIRLQEIELFPLFSTDSFSVPEMP
jgi:hypothetical protein